MAEDKATGASMFRKSAMNRITSADDLDKYININNPSAWVVLLAVAFLFVGLFVWSTTAVIPTTVNVTGIIYRDELTCWVDGETADKIREGGARAFMTELGEHELKDVTIADIPLSSSEVKSSVESDYLVEMLKLSDWNYMVSMKLPDEVIQSETMRIVPVNIVVSETHPLDLVLGKQ